jgi:hypothetical protein
LRRFYSDLRLVADSAYQRIKKEFEEYEKKNHHKHDGNLSEKLPYVICPIIKATWSYGMVRIK